VGARKAGCSDEEIEATLNWTMAIRAGMLQSLMRRADAKARRASD
jgi:hypothetical protein